MSLVQVSFGLFHFITVLLGVIQDPVIGGDASEGNGVPDDGEDQVPMLTMTLWSLETFVYFLSIFGVILLIACLVAQKAIRNVNLGGNIRFMWVLLWLLPIQIFCAIGLFDYYNVNYVTTKHRWLSPTMVWVRDLYWYASRSFLFYFSVVLRLNVSTPSTIVKRERQMESAPYPSMVEKGTSPKMHGAKRILMELPTAPQ